MIVVVVAEAIAITVAEVALADEMSGVDFATLLDCGGGGLLGIGVRRRRQA